MARRTGMAVVSVGLNLLWTMIAVAATPPLIKNANFEARLSANAPVGYELAGQATYQYLGDPRQDMASWGVALHSISNGSRDASASVSQVVKLPAQHGKSYRFAFRGLPQDGLAISTQGNLIARVEFLGNGTSYDAKNKDLYTLIDQTRHDLAVNGDHHAAGAAVWRTYSMDFTIPFPQVTALRVSVILDKGAGRRAGDSDFYVDDFDLTPLTDSLSDSTAAQTVSHGDVVSHDHLLPLGGRWFYAADPSETRPPTLFNATNADRLLYFDGEYETPFAGEMTAVLRAGEKDLSGHVSTSDRLITDNVTVRFDGTSLIIQTHGLPNHPTGKFPQTGFRGNPNYIIEQDSTYYIPLNPQPNLNHFVTAKDNSNHALNMGPIGIATNGIVFFNPFDAGSQDASNFMDACCGHPNFDGQYHYHKYPICLNTPWSDDGQAHSPLLGWAFDGYPIYGPYESKDVMAKDLTGPSKLNGFNMHYDSDRGWHYHVTPGVFPYIIGGYWGSVDRRDTRPPNHPNGMGQPR